VEAFCAALYLLGRTEAAAQVIAGFSGGDEFLKVNRVRLDRYRQAARPAEVAVAEKELFGSP
jgi:ribosome biogenesis protein Tsr3